MRINKKFNYFLNGNVNKMTYMFNGKKKKKNKEDESLETNPTLAMEDLSYDNLKEMGLTAAYTTANVDPEISRTVFFDQEITEESATQLRATLMSLAAEDTEAPIRLILGSPGGGLYESLAIYDTIKMIPNDVIAICNGKVMSGGIVILLACETRVSTPNTTFMMHHGHTTLQGNVLELKEQIDEIIELNDRMLDIIIKETKVTRDELGAWLVKDHFFNAKQAEKYGLVHKVIVKLKDL